jgi:hypothetical protein
MYDQGSWHYSRLLSKFHAHFRGHVCGAGPAGFFVGQARHIEIVAVAMPAPLQPRDRLHKLLSSSVTSTHEPGEVVENLETIAKRNAGQQQPSSWPRPVTSRTRTAAGPAPLIPSQNELWNLVCKTLYGQAGIHVGKNRNYFGLRSEYNMFVNIRLRRLIGRFVA